MKIIPFHHDGKDYEIRVISDGSTIYVRAFLNGVPANGYSYQVSLPTKFDMEWMIGINAVQELIQSAKRDVLDGVWEKLLEALKTV